MRVFIPSSQIRLSLAFFFPALKQPRKSFGKDLESGSCNGLVGDTDLVRSLWRPVFLGTNSNRVKSTHPSIVRYEHHRSLRFSLRLESRSAAHVGNRCNRPYWVYTQMAAHSEYIEVCSVIHLPYTRRNLSQSLTIVALPNVDHNAYDQFYHYRCMSWSILQVEG